MNELVALVAQKTGLSPEQAQSAVDTVLRFLKEKLPAPIAGQVDAAVNSESGPVADVAKKLGGLFGK